MRRLAWLLLLGIIPAAVLANVYFIESPDGSGGSGASGSDPYVVLALDHQLETLTYNMTLNTGTYEVNLT